MDRLLAEVPRNITTFFEDIERLKQMLGDQHKRMSDACDAQVQEIVVEQETDHTGLWEYDKVSRAAQEILDKWKPPAKEEGNLINKGSVPL